MSKKLGRPRIFSDEERKIRRIFTNIWYRCNYPGTSRFSNYGGAGVKLLMTIEDLSRLWKRDKARLLKRPSIDRIDSSLGYSFDNCQFIELSDNCRKRRMKSCSMCGGSIPIFVQYDKCKSCRMLRPCCYCGKLCRLRGLKFANCGQCGVKRCHDCQEFKPLSEFGLNARRCGHCNRKSSSAYYYRVKKKKTRGGETSRLFTPVGKEN